MSLLTIRAQRKLGAVAEAGGTVATARGMRARNASARLIIVLAGLYTVLPALLGVEKNGRSVSSTVGDSPAPSAPGALLGTTLSSSIILLCLVILANHARQQFGSAKRELGSIGLLAVFVLPWLVTILVDLASGQAAARQWVVYPLLGATFWVLAPSVQVLDALAWVIVGAAALALGMGLLDPSLGLYANPGGVVAVDKAIIGGRLLAGPFGHPNLLGGVLALGTPALAIIPRPRLRLAGFVVVYLVLLWASSRTAIVAATVAAVAYGSLSWNHRLGGALSRVLVVVGLFLVIWTPLATTDPLAFSQRGQIWMAALDYWRMRPAEGFGTDFFSTVGAVNNDLGPYAFTGHNQVVDILVKTGLLGAGALALLIAVLTSRSLKLSRLTRYPIVYVLAFIWEGWLEARIDFTNLGQTGVVVWIPIALIFFGTMPEASLNTVQPIRVARGGLTPSERSLLRRGRGQVYRGPLPRVHGADR